MICHVAVIEFVARLGEAVGAGEAAAVEAENLARRVRAAYTLQFGSAHASPLALATMSLRGAMSDKSQF